MVGSPGLRVCLAIHKKRVKIEVLRQITAAMTSQQISTKSNSSEIMMRTVSYLDQQELS